MRFKVENDVLGVSSRSCVVSRRGLKAFAVSPCVSGQSDIRGGEERGLADGQWASPQRWRRGGYSSRRGAGQDCVQGQVCGLFIHWHPGANGVKFRNDRVKPRPHVYQYFWKCMEWKCRFLPFPLFPKNSRPHELFLFWFFTSVKNIPVYATTRNVFISLTRSRFVKLDI